MPTQNLLRLLPLLMLMMRIVLATVFHSAHPTEWAESISGIGLCPSVITLKMIIISACRLHRPLFITIHMIKSCTKTKTMTKTTTKTKAQTKCLKTQHMLYRDGICHSRHSRRECKIFASGVNFSRNNAVCYINESKKLHFTLISSQKLLTYY